MIAFVIFKLLVALCDVFDLANRENTLRMFVFLEPMQLFAARYCSLGDRDRTAATWESVCKKAPKEPIQRIPA